MRVRGELHHFVRLEVLRLHPVRSRRRDLRQTVRPQRARFRCRTRAAKKGQQAQQEPKKPILRLSPGSSSQESKSGGSVAASSRPQSVQSGGTQFETPLIGEGAGRSQAQDAAGLRSASGLVTRGASSQRTSGDARRRRRRHRSPQVQQVSEVGLTPVKLSGE